MNEVQVEVLDAELSTEISCPSHENAPRHGTNLVQALETALSDGLIIYPAPLGRNPQLFPLQATVPNALSGLDLVSIDLATAQRRTSV